VSAEQPDLSGKWLVIAPASHTDHEHTTNCLQTITDHGGHPHLLTEDFTQQLTAHTTEPPTGIISLLALDETPHPTHPAVPTGLATTIHLIQTLDTHLPTTPLHHLTTHAVTTHPHQPLTHPTQAHTWGLARVAALETPHRTTTLIDLPTTWHPTTPTHLATALTHPTEDQLALRDTIHTRRLTHTPLTHPTPTNPTPLNPNGTILITGGTGALGSHIARWHARQHHHLHLISRQGPHHPNAHTLHQELLELGAPTVTITACDTTNPHTLATTLATIPHTHPLTAVIHTAGIA
ncbi:KR domain-containing protein, partial [Streptomyces sp. P17]|uniref:KR domain-containing protein n=1 Tax=Streptomyces sp. P17 TaxID=3074716 RepID=UPI0028F3EE0B